jgi:type VI protein secretion system component Hcp
VANINVDILMKLVDDKGAIEAESQSVISTKDDFTKDFELTKFFDVEEFDFDIGLDDDDDSDNTNSSSSNSSSSSSKSDKDKKKKKGSKFTRWLGGTRNLKTDGYPIEVQPFSFTRQYDWASPTLFQYCANSTSLKSATLVQRKAGQQNIAIGNDGKSYGVNPCFLRIDFYDLLLTNISWDIADAVLKEKIKFVCRRIKVQYKVQDETGAMYATTHGEWSFNAQLK